ncbi:hypothetical protein [Falsiroseomonas stagni]|uniref:hypothetical protein n=1 Tax=Falsiroseomonas stagni TaxID=484882 RepID=UPI0011146AB1|nr:hypothetical protein [Falsiroseomonas stagni]
MAADSKDEHEWAWEFHKQCDALLHSRLAAYFTGQSFLLTSFTLIIINPAHGPKILLYLVAILGLFTGIIWLFVNVAMFARLEALNEKYLFRKNEDRLRVKFKAIENDKAEKMRDVFTFYIRDSIQETNLWFPLPSPLRLYKYFIPYATPFLFVFLWAAILICLSFSLF